MASTSSRPIGPEARAEPGGPRPLPPRSKPRVPRLAELPALPAASAGSPAAMAQSQEAQIQGQTPDREQAQDQGQAPDQGQVREHDQAQLPAPAGERPADDPERWAALGAEKAPPRKQASPKSLVGLDEAGMRRLLGEPTWAEEVPPGRYWQYASRSCVLRVFFFLEMDTQRFRALSYELTSTENAPDVDEQCFDQLLRQASDQAARLDSP